MFTHLHVHTEFSLLDGMSKIKEIVQRAKELGQTALAITDHGTAAGLVAFYDECKKQGIKPVLGCEFYITSENRFDKKADQYGEKYYHLIALVKNQQGYTNLCKLVTRSHTEGFYAKPRIDWELLKEHHEGLIVTSACIAGEIPSAILRNNITGAENLIEKYKSVFGDDFYLEIQNHGINDEARAYPMIAQLAEKHGVKTVATNDVHYVYAEDKVAHEWLCCLQTQKTIADPTHMVYEGDYSLKSEDEMRALFPENQDACENTNEVAEKCNFDFVYGNYRMPKVVIPEKYGSDYFGYMRDEAWKGFEERYPEGNAYREQAKKDLEYELDVIKNMGFAEYFLDTRKTIMYAKDRGILVGPGRGSGAGSRTNYCLKITDIEPIQYGLLFSRFLNPERISMPDIDVDYDHAFKDDIIKSEAESNGYDKFAKIRTFGAMLAKGILRDCARVAGMSVAVGTKLASFIDDNQSLSEIWEQSSELREYVNSETELQELWKIALRLEGTKKSAGTHACGHIPTPVPCEELFPCALDKETGYLVCEYDMAQAEHLGNLKKDLLMLKNLTIIDEARKAIKKRRGIDVPLWTEEVLNDKESLELIAEGDTNGIFQLESDGMKENVKALHPTSFEDIIAMVSLYRPGPMEYIPDYIENKHNPEKISYLTPRLEPILKPTNGIIVYQGATRS